MSIKHLPSKVYNNVFSPEEIQLLQEDQRNRLPTNEFGDKNLDYQLKISVSNKIIRPKINEIVGNDHVFANGCYKEERRPYATHIDNINYHKHHKQYYMFSTDKRYERAVLIPLVEGPEFRTVLFDIFTEDDVGMGQLLPEHLLGENNDLDLDMFSHIPEPTRSQIRHYPVDQIVTWKLGSVITWNKNQLHTSTDFAKHNLQKNFVVLFLA